MPASKDSLSYVKPVPLPIQSSKGLRILARDTINFNPEFPSRDEVRKNNYYRRQTQMSSMGFRSANHKPYMGIGDPFYLDEKKMILHALGQWSEEYASSSSSEEESDDNDDNKDKTPKPAFTAAKFVLRRSRKDLNTLNKAVVHGRNMIRNVSLGHGLFDLINKEKQTKTAASEAEFRKRQEQLRNEFQPPKNESDDSDEDLDNEVDLSSYMVPVAQPTFLTQQTDTDEELGIVNDNAASESDQSPEREAEFVTFSGMKMAEEEEEFQRSRSAAVTSAMTSTYSRPTSRRKKKQETPRPYTPQHTNLSANLSTRESLATDGETDMDITKDALFRQLCVLHWILEAMSTDPPSPMTPIMSCWSLTEIGGARAQPKKLQKDKVTEQGWANFLSKDTSRTVKNSPRVQVVAPQKTKSKPYQQVSKRLSSQRMSRSPHIRRPLHTPGRNSGQSSATGSQQGSTTEGLFASKLMSLLKPKQSADRNQSPNLRRGSATSSRSPSPATKPMSKMAALFGNLKSKGQGNEGHDIEPSPDSSQMSGQGQVDPEKAQSPVPATNLMRGLLNRKIMGVASDSKPVPPETTVHVSKADDKDKDQSQTQVTPSSPSKALAMMGKKKADSADSKTVEAPPVTVSADKGQSAAPASKMAGLFGKKAAAGQSDNNKSEGKQPPEEKDKPQAATGKGMGLFGKMMGAADNKTPANPTINTPEPNDTAQAPVNKPAPKGMMAALLGKKKAVTDSANKAVQELNDNSVQTLKDSSPAIGNQSGDTVQDTNRLTPTGSNRSRSVSPKLAAILKPRGGPRTSLKGAAGLGQFLEFKMRGGLNTVASQMSMLNVRNRAGMDEEPLSPKPEEDDDQAYNKSIFKFLDEYYESLKNEEDKNNKQLATKSPSSTPPTSPTPDKQKKEEKKKKKKKKRENSAGQKEKRLDHKVAVALGEEEKMSSKYLRANAHLIRAKSSPALVEFQNTLPSNKRGVLTADLHNQFAECREEKALTLHDILDHKEGQRMTVCKSKFLSFGGLIHGSSFHRAVKEMRLDSHQRLRTPVSEQKKQTSKGNWYTDLMDKIPEELKHEWYYNKILQKLGNFGLVEGTGKQSIYKFIKVLEGLREWEICSPDITAAIEFCRERIVEMTIEEYESWFTQRFPKITRPQTAPPVQKTEKKESVLGSASTVRRVMPKRPTQSAFVRRVQR